jgi:hypothetical protein
MGSLSSQPRELKSANLSHYGFFRMKSGLKVPRMTAREALAGLEGVLTPEEADAWLKDSRGDFDESARDPWA